MENTLLNLIPAAYLPEIHLSQYDAGRTITFTLKDGASDYSVPSGASVKVKATKPSGFGFEVACTFNGGTVTLVTTETMTLENGRFPAELSIVSGNTTIGTSNFIFNIERSPHPEGTIDGDAETILPELTLLVNEIRESNAKVESMTASATSLPAGSEPTAEYDVENNNLAFRIPQGEPGSGAVGTVANAYDSSKTYVVGDYAIHNNDLYRCMTAITTAEAFTASHWAKIVLVDDVTDLKSDLTGLKNNFPSITVKDSILTIEGGETLISNIKIDAEAGTSSAVITRCGKNMYPKYASGSSDGLSWTVADDGTITFTGTPSADVFLRLRNIFIPTKGGTHTVAFFNNMYDANRRLTFFGVTPEHGNWQVNLTTENTIGTEYSAVAEDNIIELRIRIPKDIDWTGLILRPMLVQGSVIGEFEEYNGQSFNVTLDENGNVQENISLLSGINTIWSNAGDVSISYVEKIADYVNDQIATVKNQFYQYTANGSAKYLYIYYRSGDGWVRWELHNVPAVESNSNTWQIGRVCGLDADFSNLTEIVAGGEFELAFKEHGAADYCGGNNHGDENTDTFILHIDGKVITLNDLDSNMHEFNRIDAFEIATVNRADTPNDDILTHQKIWTFEDGKVKVKQTLKFLEELQVDGVLVCMMKALREYFKYGIRQGGVAIEDMSQDGYSHITTTSDDIFYLMYGNNVTAKVHASTDNADKTSALFIDAQSTTNKLYYGYYGAVDRTNPVTVPQNTIIQAESEYDVAYTPSV